MHLGLVSRFVLILAASGWIVSVVNLMHLAERSGWIVPVVDDLPSLLVSTLLVIVAALTPTAFRLLVLSARDGTTAQSGKKSKPQSVGRFLFNSFSTVRLTIMLLAASVVLVFFGTLDQVHYGIYHAQNKYFAHAFVVWEYPLQFIWGEYLSWFHLTMPGGYLLGPLLVVNLAVAHFRYFRPSWKKAGIPLIHGGIILLLLGQLWTQVRQVDYFMWLGEGESSNFVEAFHYDEFVVIDKSDPDSDRVFSWNIRALENANGVLSHNELPFVIDVVWFAKNAAIFPRSAARTNYGVMPFDRGLGAERDYVVLAMPPTYAEGERNVTSAIVRLSGDDGRIGTWLVSNIFRQTLPLREFFPVQSFEYDGRQYEIAIRFKRAYLPAELELIEFRHDRYPGTDIPFNFSSEMRIHNPETGSSRNALIYMNHPLRFGGLTFYQASFADEDTKSMLQVVSNPARWVPYVSSLIISAGLTLQFVISLFVHARRRKTS